MRFFDGTEILVLLTETVLKVSLVLIAAGVIGSAIRRKFPSGAHLTWVLAFCAVVAIPVTSLFVPWKSVLFLNIQPASTSGFRPERERAAYVNTLPASTAPVQPVNAGNNADQPDRSRVSNFTLLLLDSPWLVGAFALWLIGFLGIAARSAYGLCCLRFIRRFHTTAVSSKWFMFEARRLANEAGQHRDFDLRICSNDKLPMPMTWGVFRPTIVLPQDAVDWTDKRFEATLLHELSHVRRYDFLSQMLAEFACALYWFNPLVWLSARTMRSDAELAADEAVLHAGLKPSDYATELLSLATDLGKRPIPFATLGTPAMSNSKIETRLESILAPTAGRRGVTTIQVLAALTFAVLAVPTLASFHVSAQAQSSETQAERHEALSRIKQAGLATLMYSNDADDYYPYVQQTASAIEVLQPYSKSHEIFESPTKGGKFNFNMNVAGVSMTSIDFPAEIPMWVETLRDPKAHVVVCYCDGHAKLIDPNAMPDPNHSPMPGVPIAPGLSILKATLTRHFPRDKSMRPLPADYLLPINP